MLLGLQKAETLEELITREGRQAVGEQPAVRPTAAAQQCDAVCGCSHAAVTVVRVTVAFAAGVLLLPRQTPTLPACLPLSLRVCACVCACVSVVAPAVEAEAKMLKGMRGQMRCCTATIGDAAAADAELYPNLYGTILIWLGAAGPTLPAAEKNFSVTFLRIGGDDLSADSSTAVSCHFR